MIRKIFILFLFIFMCSAAFASDVQVWHDPALNITALKKIFVMPVNSSLKAGNQLMPARQLNANLTDWTIAGINSAFKKKGVLTVKTLDDVINDMKFIYDDGITSGDVFFKRAAEMGYKAFVTVNVTQEFKTEHVPENIRTYTVYREIEKRDAKGRVIETIRIPEEKTEVEPAHDVTYLYTVCRPELYSTEDHNGDYIAVVNYSIYREYQNGPVMQVVENIIKASMKNLFTKK